MSMEDWERRVLCAPGAEDRVKWMVNEMVELVAFSSNWRLARLKLGDQALDEAVRVLSGVNGPSENSNTKATHLIAIAQAHYLAANIRAKWVPLDD